MIIVEELSTTTMMIKCRDCGYEHPSAVQMGTSDFSNAMLHEKREQCPKCGSVSTYYKSEYFFL